MGKHGAWSGAAEGWEGGGGVGGSGEWKHICSAFDPSVCGPARRSPRLPTLRLTRKQPRTHGLARASPRWPAQRRSAPVPTRSEETDLRTCDWEAQNVGVNFHKRRFNHLFHHSVELSSTTAPPPPVEPPPTEAGLRFLARVPGNGCSSLNRSAPAGPA